MDQKENIFQQQQQQQLQQQQPQEQIQTNIKDTKVASALTDLKNESQSIVPQQQQQQQQQQDTFQKQYLEAKQKFIKNEFIDISGLEDEALKEVTGKLIIKDVNYGFVSHPTKIMLVQGQIAPTNTLQQYFQIQWLFPDNSHSEEKDWNFVVQNIQPHQLYKQVAFSYPLYAKSIQENQEKLQISSDQIESMIENVAEFKQIHDRLIELKNNNNNNNNNNKSKNYPSKSKLSKHKDKSKNAQEKVQKQTQKAVNSQNNGKVTKNKSQQSQPKNNVGKKQKKETQDKQTSEAPKKSQDKTNNKTVLGEYVPIKIMLSGRKATSCSYPKEWVYVAGDVKLKDYKDKEFDSEAEFVVERIVDQDSLKLKDANYLVKYKGYELNPADWLSHSEICQNIALSLWTKERDKYQFPESFYKSLL